jgi:hypothetical protein
MHWIWVIGLFKNTSAQISNAASVTTGGVTFCAWPFNAQPALSHLLSAVCTSRMDVGQIAKFNLG